MRQTAFNGDSAGPLVSVGMPIFNNGVTLDRALGSILRQDYSNIEIHLSDDASMDNSHEILGKYRFHDNLNISINAKNVGAHANLSKVLSLSKGKYFLWASGDDYWDPGFISTLVRGLEENRGSAVAMCATKRVWERGLHEDIVRFSGNNGKGGYSTFELARSLIIAKDKSGKLTKNNLFIQGLLERERFQAAIEAYPGLFKERLLLCQLALSGSFVFVDKILYEKSQRGSFQERNPFDPFSAVMDDKLIKDVYRLARSLLSSKIIPPSNKLKVPLLLLNFVLHRLHIRAAILLNSLLPASLRDCVRRNAFYRCLVRYYYR